MAEDSKLEFLDGTGSYKYSLQDLKAIDGALELKAIEFLKNVEKKIRDKQIIASGKLLDAKSFSSKVQDKKDGVKELLLYMIEYGAYVDKGVKGWKSKKNAPKSPYQFKTKGMNEQGRKSIQSYIESGKAKVRNVAYKKEGLETKFEKQTKSKKTEIEKQVDEVVWNIKKYGIKTTNFYTDAFNETFKDLGKELSEAIGKDIIVKLKMMNE